MCKNPWLPFKKNTQECLEGLLLQGEEKNHGCMSSPMHGKVGRNRVCRRENRLHLDFKYLQKFQLNTASADPNLVRWQTLKLTHLQTLDTTLPLSMVECPVMAQGDNCLQILGLSTTLPVTSKIVRIIPSCYFPHIIPHSLGEFISVNYLKWKKHKNRVRNNSNIFEITLLH